jgi:glycosyltransferase involved in cell wall biosynthesis
VITTAPARSAHLVGWALRRRGTPWVADFRDGWRFEDQRAPWAHHALDKLDGWLERAVVRRADVCVGVTQPITADLRERAGAADAETITNGFDPDDADLVAAASPPLDSNGRVTVVHTGSLAYGGRDPRPVVDALRLLRREDPATAARLQVLFAGPISSEERAAIEADDVDGLARALGPLPRPDALALQRAADALLLITGDDQLSIATGKLYEYLAAQRPILVLGERSEAARLVREAKAGIATSASDPRAIARALRDLLRTGAGRSANADLERFSYARIAAQMAAAAERAINAAR